MTNIRVSKDEDDLRYDAWQRYKARRPLEFEEIHREEMEKILFYAGFEEGLSVAEGCCICGGEINVYTKFDDDWLYYCDNCFNDIWKKRHTETSTKIP